ncbi:hypothetical protein [Pyruvatibacter sp.]|uniref:hypothetical protein n=1 Tax=Pyruvatibacter sp. TaxID=1981328 RepID=UPI0032669623
MKFTHGFISTLLGVALMTLTVAGPSVHAQTPQSGPLSRQALDLYDAGSYTKAAKAGLREQTAAGDALAARAFLAAARTGSRGNRGQLVAEAQEAASSAITRDPAYIEGHMQLAVALGYQGRALGDYIAHQQGLATKARDAIDTALSLEPDNAWARALSGTWHLEIVKGAGPLLASALYDANRAGGLADIRAAVETQDVSIIVLHQCALQLLAHNADTFGQEAERILIAARNMPAQNAFERFTARQIDRLLRAYRSGNDAMLKREIDRAQASY